MYKLINDPITKELTCIHRLEDNTFISLNSESSDYQAYLAWLEQGNEPLPADEVSNGN